MTLRRRIMGTWVIGTSAVATLVIIAIMIWMTVNIFLVGGETLK